MSRRMLPGARRLTKIRTISLSLVVGGLFNMGHAYGQESPPAPVEEPNEATPDAAPAPTEATETTAPGTEPESTESPTGGGSESANDETGAPEEPGTDGLQSAESGGDNGAPLEEEPAPVVEEEPDYFGSYEPSAPSYRTNPDYVPEEPRYNGPFRAGRLSLGPSFGGGTIGDQTYFILGANVGYFIVNGLQVHVDTDFWLIGDPTIITPSPGLRYVFWMVPKVHPYVGAFYRRYIVTGDIDGADSVGGRAGVYFDTGPTSYFGIGAYYEQMLQDHLFSVDAFYGPEVAFGFAF